MKRTVFFLLLALFLTATGIVTGFSETTDDKRGKAAPQDLLPDDLKNQTVKDYHIKGKGKPIGYIRTIRGYAVIRHDKTGEAYFAAKGDRLYEKDIIYTLKSSRCRVKFSNADLITIGENTHIGIDEYLDNRKKQSKTSRFSMLRGKAMFYVVRLFKYKKTVASVNTPTAVCGVRGTKFGVEVTEITSGLASLLRPIYLADASNKNIMDLLAQNEQGGRTQTRIFGFDGRVSVRSKADGSTLTVGAGQDLTVLPGGMGAGGVRTTNFSDAAGFTSSTQVPDEGDDDDDDLTGDDDDDVTGDDDDDATGSDGDDATGDDDDDATGDDDDATGDDDGGTLSGGEGPPPIDDDPLPVPLPIDPPGFTPEIESYLPKQGFFASMLTKNSSLLGEIYVSMTGQDYINGPVLGNSLIHPGYFMEMLPPVDDMSNPYLGRFVALGTDSGNLGNNYEFTSSYPESDLGYMGISDEDYFMEWGWMLLEQPVTSGGNQYNLNNRLYYILGSSPEEYQMANFMGTVEYKGPAYGTLWSASGGENMTGDFFAKVNFDNFTIPDFNLYVGNTASNVSAEIYDASGSISGNTFDISGGEWEMIINGNLFSADSRSAHGSFYWMGEETDHPASLGGVWGMYNSANDKGVVGVFAGGSNVVPPGEEISYFTSMLVMDPYGYPGLEDVMITHQNIGAVPLEAQSITGTPDYIKMNGFFNYLSIVNTIDGSKTLGTNYSISRTELYPSFSQFEWGKWNLPASYKDFDIATYTYIPLSRYYITGISPPDATMNTFDGTVNYEGEAYGSWWDYMSGTEKDMKGHFSCDVDFDNNSVYNAGLFVVDPDNTVSASFFNASGSITGSRFDLSGGHWELYDYNYQEGYHPTNNRQANGSFYWLGFEKGFPSALGGVWGMKDDTLCIGAAGVFGGLPSNSEHENNWEEYFTGLLTSFGTLTELADVYITQDNSAVDPSTGITESKSVIDKTQGHLMLNSFNMMNLVEVKKHSSPSTIPLSSPQHDVFFNSMQRKPYMEWGEWEVSDPGHSIMIDGDNHQIIEKGYYLNGGVTHPDDMPTTGMVYYDGPAYGSYSMAPSPDMDGSFSCEVNFGNNQITNVQMSVSNYQPSIDERSASITGASGSITNSNHFILDNTSGSWELNNGGVTYTPTSKAANGSFFGPNTQQPDMGGNWGMYKDQNNGASGIMIGQPTVP